MARVGVYVSAVSRQAGWRRVLLDDLQDVQPDRRTALLKWLETQVEARVVDQALCACVDDGWRPGGPFVYVSRDGILAGA